MFKLLIYLLTLNGCIGCNIYLLQGQDHQDSVYFNKLYDSVWNSYDQYDYQKAAVYCEKIFQFSSKNSFDIASRLSKTYNLAGLIKRKQGELAEAINYYQLALDNSSDNYFKTLVNNNLAVVFSDQGDYVRALEYYKDALRNIAPDDYKAQAYIYHNIGYAYYLVSNWSEALENYLRSIEINKQNIRKDIGDSYYSCALVYQKTGELRLSDYYSGLSIKSYENEYGINHFKTAMAYGNYAVLLYERGNYVESKEYYLRAYKVLLKAFGKKHLYVSNCERDLGSLFLAMGNYPEALLYLQRSLISKYKGFNELNIYNNPDRSIFPDIDLIEILNLKALAFEKLSEVNEPIKNLKAAIEVIDLTAGFIEKLRASYLSEPSKLKLTENEQETYASGVRIASKLFFTTNDKKYLDLAFRFSERSKYGILRELRREAEARNYAGIPDSLLLKERKLLQELASCQANIYEENLKEVPDVDFLNELNEKLFELSEKRGNLIRNLEKNYPGYYLMKYSNEVVQLNDIQKFLSPSQTLIEYSLHDSLMYIFLISKDTSILTVQKSDTLFYNEINVFRQCMLSDYSLPYSKYHSAAYNLYLHLIKPVEKYLPGKKLIIVPDGVLNLISFDALLTSDEKGNPLNMYRDENYLLEKYPISYAFSANHLVNSVGKKKRFYKNFVGFAPDYTSSPDSLKNIQESFTSLMKIKRMFFGKAFIGENATEGNFKKTDNYNILHCYLHGLEDTLNPSLSRIFFSQDPGSLEDSYVYAYELSNMMLNYNLTTIISCYSGSGSIAKGEGVLSIGRSFANAGSPSIILSIWQVPSGTAFSIMKLFYKNLLHGKSKAESLQRAKLKYLEEVTGIDANPSVWSGLILVGNPDSMFKGYYIKIFLIPGMIILLIVFLIIRRKLF